ncbi:unnamed protein product [Phytomonas sp. EM1]|nr:unnamed protein product [Phytomonas sp. EM1]|eukprot:CCW63999.1 unnamed protein product [Phytomonas sp. isolate EM1]
MFLTPFKTLPDSGDDGQTMASTAGAYSLGMSSSPSWTVFHDGGGWRSARSNGLATPVGPFGARPSGRGGEFTPSGIHEDVMGWVSPPSLRPMVGLTIRYPPPAEPYHDALDLMRALAQGKPGYTLDPIPEPTPVDEGDERELDEQVELLELLLCRRQRENGLPIQEFSSAFDDEPYTTPATIFHKTQMRLNAYEQRHREACDKCLEAMDYHPLLRDR